MACNEFKVREEPADLINESNVLNSEWNPRAGNTSADADWDIELNALGIDRVGEGGTSASEEAIARLGLLTRQQARILQLICEGKLNKQIAYELNIAETTVKAHVTAIMRKLGVLSRTQAVLMAKEARFSAMVPEG